MDWHKWLLGAGIAFVALVGSTRAADQTVTATSSNTFSPNDVTITQGEKVTWTNAGGSHNVVFDDGNFTVPSSPSSTWPAVVERRFSETGNFTYFCANPQHDGMTGIVRVTAAAPPPGGGGGGGSGGGGDTESPTLPKVTLKVSDARPELGQKVRLYGFVRPALDGARVQIQRRRRNGAFKKVATTTLRDAGEKRSKFSIRIRVVRDIVVRARVPAGDDREAATSRKKRLNVI